MANKINLPFYNLNSFPDIGGSAIVSGPSFSGKTTFVLDLLSSKSNILNYAVVFSGTEKYSPAFGAHIHSSMIHEKLTEKAFTQVVNYHKMNFAKNPSLRVAIILDDCMSDTKFLSWPVVGELFFQSRHIGIFFFVITQHLLIIQNKFRNSCAVIAFCKNPSTAVRKSYHSQFFSGFGTFNQFDSVFQFYTSANRILILDCKKLSYDPKQNVTYYKSNSFRHGNYCREFQIGNPDLWRLLDSKKIENKSINPFLPTLF